MGMRVKQRGDFNNLGLFLKRMKRKEFLKYVNRYAQEGVEALSRSTPVDTGRTAASWSYEIYNEKDTTKIVWSNGNTNEHGYPIVLLIEYGHVGPEGTYVEGYEFVEQSIRPIFDNIVDSAWKEVCRR